MDLLRRIAEARIREAMERGELDGLPTQGKRVPVDDLSQVPEDLRMGFMVLKNAGLLPEELELHKELLSLQSLIDCCEDGRERAGLRRRLNEKTLRYRMILERRLHPSSLGKYGRKIRRRLGL